MSFVILIPAKIVTISYSFPNNISNNSVGLTSSDSKIQHIVIIVMENRGYPEVIYNPNATYQNQLAKDYAIASKYYAVKQESLPNYISMIAGAPLIKENMDPNETKPLSQKNLIDLFEAKKITWKSYNQDMPGVCDLTDFGESNYTVHHNPFVYFSDIRNNKERCNNVVGLDQFSQDLKNGNLPNYSFVVPNDFNNTHDTTVAYGDHWLSTFLPEIINSTVFNSTVVFITYDEGQENSTEGFGNGIYAVNGGHLPMIIVSPLVKSGFRSPEQYSHYSLLSTVEKIFNTGNLGRGDASAIGKPMMDLFRSPL
jgi:phospholipase C